MKPQNEEYNNELRPVLTETVGRAIVLAFSRLPLTADACVRSQDSICGICGGQSATGTGFPPSSSGFLCQCRSITALYINIPSANERQARY
jgi:hypothetical protein